MGAHAANMVETDRAMTRPKLRMRLTSMVEAHTNIMAIIHHPADPKHCLGIILIPGLAESPDEALKFG